jgi:methionyl-tRNA synthetase
MTTTTYVTNAIPYVNGDPHLGHALEFIQADAIARHRRARGQAVRYLSGTDDHAFKNVLAAEAAGQPVAAFVDARAERFAALREPLELSHDAFIRTSVDPRHRAGVERLWRACAAAGDLYQRDYEGRYCTGCEAFLAADELVDGRCPEHAAPLEHVVERNWFFRLSRYRAPLEAAIASGALRVEPETRRNEVLAVLRGGLEDFSVSRASERARGWGIPVPGDPSQTIYVWFDALANYVTELGYATDDAAFARWWLAADERIHVVGKGITRFHALYWPAILLSAGLPLPTRVLVHGYLTVDGAKIGKSSGNGADPAAVAATYGVDALRWGALAAVPRGGAADVRADVLARTADRLADGLGNLVNRTIALTLRAGDVPPAPPAPADELALALLAQADGLPARIDDAFEAYDLPTAAGAHDALVDAANRSVAETAPWTLLRPARAGDAAAAARLALILAPLRRACDVLAAELAPFLPRASERLAEALERLDPDLGRGLFR